MSASQSWTTSCFYKGQGVVMDSLLVCESSVSGCQLLGSGNRCIPSPYYTLHGIWSRSNICYITFYNRQLDPKYLNYDNQFKKPLHICNTYQTFGFFTVTFLVSLLLFYFALSLVPASPKWERRRVIHLSKNCLPKCN